MNGRPVLAITVGDPSGVGPEIAVKAARDPRVIEVCRPVLYGPHLAADLEPYPAGVVDAKSGRAAYDAIVSAVEDAQAGRVAGIVTAPINKESFAAAGLSWRGHTDLLAELCGVPEAAMMFWSERLRVVLATVHIPLREVPARLTTDGLLRTIRLTHASMPRFGVVLPRIGVAGLNPHAGENGLLGGEDRDVIRPAIDSPSARASATAGAMTAASSPPSRPPSPACGLRPVTASRGRG